MQLGTREGPPPTWPSRLRAPKRACPGEGLVPARVLSLRKPVIKHKVKLKLMWAWGANRERDPVSRKVPTDQVPETSWEG